MTKKLETLLNLPSAEEITTEQGREFVEENRGIIQQVDSAIDKIDAALPGVHNLDTGDSELDELAEIAKSRAEDLIDLGMNVDPRFAGVILQTASTMLGHAITAKTAKMDKKLKTIQLQLQKAKLDHQIIKDNKKALDDDDDVPIEGKGIVLDRNELLQQILNNQRSNK
jgi:hypothetical protein